MWELSTIVFILRDYVVYNPYSKLQNFKNNQVT